MSADGRVSVTSIRNCSPSPVNTACRLECIVCISLSLIVPDIIDTDIQFQLHFHDRFRLTKSLCDFTPLVG
jgi:hypothetical protein